MKVKGGGEGGGRLIKVEMNYICPLMALYAARRWQPDLCRPFDWVYPNGCITA